LNLMHIDVIVNQKAYFVSSVWRGYQRMTIAP
jgi:hypothetical protein